MKKKTSQELFNIFYGKGYNNLYEGFSGYLFRYAHRKLEDFAPDGKKNILEIGPGRYPHYDYINENNISKYTLFEKNISNIKYLKKKFIRNKKVKIIKSLKKNINFDRIILSHVLEHIYNPEEFLDSIFKKLKKGGYLSITLPCDPGLSWDFGREVTYYKFWRKHKVLKNEYYYHMSKEHVNSVRNLRRIINYKYENTLEQFLPLKIPSYNFNLFYNVTIKK